EIFNETNDFTSYDYQAVILLIENEFFPIFVHDQMESGHKIVYQLIHQANIPGTPTHFYNDVGTYKLLHDQVILPHYNVYLLNDQGYNMFFLLLLESLLYPDFYRLNLI